MAVEYHAPERRTSPASTLRSNSSPSRSTPLPYKISNSAVRNGGASLFLATCDDNGTLEELLGGISRDPSFQPQPPTFTRHVVPEASPSCLMT